MYFVRLLEKYGFALVLLFCFGFFTPDLTPKLGLMFEESYKASGDTKGNVVKQAFWLFMFFFFMWRSVKCPYVFDKRKAGLILVLLMLCGIALVSVLWSDFPQLTIKRSIFQMLFCFTVVTSLYFTLYHNNFEKCLVIASVLILLLTLVAVLKGTGFSTGGSLIGFSKGKNMLGQNIMVLLALMFLTLKMNVTSSRILIYLAAVFFVLLLMTQSKTSIMLFALFSVLFKYLPNLSRLLIPSLFIVLCSIFILIPSFSYFFVDFIHIGNYISPSAITGRGLIWTTLYDDLDIYNKFYLGYGYSSYFQTGVVPLMFDDDWSYLKRIGSTHNGYIDILIQLGVIGSCAVMAIIIFIYKGINNNYLKIACIIPIIYNFTEATFMRDQTMMWFFTLIIFAISRAALPVKRESK
ncbi:O-antigen ligase family protein [Colwellia sp. TT2012]|uniref:O-antigen ligase family protein n=1 Tax=Colwellia sp. TT2012 TaxID=1720342 RepID=UPI00070EE4CD|nr:O-antigen ligase family protein [Colwellia sp. TT2012]